MDTVGKALFLCDLITGFDQSKHDWSMAGQQKPQIRALQRAFGADQYAQSGGHRPG
jgi:hypothetical protein